MNAFGASLRVPDLLASHVLLGVCGAGCSALAISLPLAVVAARRPTVARAGARLRQPRPDHPGPGAARAVLSAAAGALGADRRRHAGARLPAVAARADALCHAADPAERRHRAAPASTRRCSRRRDGVGMTRVRRSCGWSRLPLAAPVLMAGIRTAAVWTIGAATLSTTVGQPSLGDLIFAGLQTQNWVLVLAGCVAAAVLALAVDALLGADRARHRAAARACAGWIAPGVLARSALLAALAPMLGRARARPLRSAPRTSPNNISSPALIGHRLEAAGYRVATARGWARPSSSARCARAMSTSMSIIPARSGPTRCSAPTCRRAEARCWRRSAAGWRRSTASSCSARSGSKMPMPSRCAATTRAALGIATLADLARAAPRLTFGADLEFLERPEWAAVRDAYGLRFRPRASVLARPSCTARWTAARRT